MASMRSVGWWMRKPRVLVLAVCGGGVLLCLLAVLHMDGVLQQGCDCHCPESRHDTNNKHTPSHSASSYGHRMAVLVPLRDRFEELQEFVVYMSNFLQRQGVQHHIFAINQVDGLRFNRASLLNAGFLELPDSYDYIVLHDVDLLPDNPAIHYDFPSKGPLHLSAPYLHPRYHYPTFTGGVLALTRTQFQSVNGMSNVYWGWGMEDDEFYVRMKEAELSIQRPANLSTGYKSFRHLHDRRVRKRDQIRCYDQHLITSRRDRRTGLNSLRYSLLSTRHLTIDGAAVTVLNVELHCSREQTPWCDCQHNTGNSNKEQREALLRGVPARDVIAPKLDRKKHLSPDQ